MNTGLKSLKDEELVRLFKSGNEQAFDELYFRYAPKLKKLIYYNLGDVDESNDVFHDVFIRVYKHIDSYNVNMPFSSWIYKIAVNCSKNYRRKSIRNEVLIEKEKTNINTVRNESTPEELYIKDADMQEFYKAVDSLKDKFRTVFLLRFDHGLQYRDISEITNCSERTAKWRMQKAVEKITDYLKDRGII
jgi:RNA polymerase sigma-70 factor (ECF subfamily)